MQEARLQYPVREHLDLEGEAGAFFFTGYIIPVVPVNIGKGVASKWQVDLSYKEKVNNIRKLNISSIYHLLLGYVNTYNYFAKNLCFGLLSA